MIRPAISETPVTLGTAYKQGLKALQGISESASLDARILLAHATNMSPDRVPLQLNDPILEPALRCFQDLIARRQKQEPVAYLTGQQAFWSFSLAVSRDTLIPRPDTESLVEAILEHRTDDKLTFLDMGTGTGAISLALLQDRPGWRGVATDISTAALAVARKNAVALGCETRLTFLQGDWYAAIEGGLHLDKSGGPFDLIVSNPPYIRPDIIETLSCSVRDFEPRQALDGGVDGLDAYRHILDGVHRHLTPTGMLAVEIGYDQGSSVSALMQNVFQTVRQVQDLAGHSRCILGQGLK